MKDNDPQRELQSDYICDPKLTALPRIVGDGDPILGRFWWLIPLLIIIYTLAVFILFSWDSKRHPERYAEDPNRPKMIIIPLQMP